MPTLPAGHENPSVLPLARLSKIIDFLPPEAGFDFPLDGEEEGEDVVADVVVLPPSSS